MTHAASRDPSGRAIAARQAGMTLVEMLVVLAIIAIIASVTVLATGAGSGRAGQAEAERLQSRLQFAADRTMVTDEGIALVAGPRGYRFVEMAIDEGEWRPSALPALGREHELPRGMTLTSSDSRPVLPLGAYAGGQGFELTLTADGRVWTVAFDGLAVASRPAIDAPAAGT